MQRLYLKLKMPGGLDGQDKFVCFPQNLSCGNNGDCCDGLTLEHVDEASRGGAFVMPFFLYDHTGLAIGTCAYQPYNRMKMGFRYTSEAEMLAHLIC